MKKNIKAIILAAGEGTRLRPYTADKPKCMVEYNDRPLLLTQIEILKKSGINDIVVVTGYKSEKIEELNNVKIIKNSNFNSSNMVYSLFCAEEELDSKSDTLICYSDILYNEEIVNKIIDCREVFCTTIDLNWKSLWKLRNEDFLEDAETLKFDRDGFIVEIGKKPHSESDIEGQYMGIIKVGSDFAEDFKNFYKNLDEDIFLDGKNKDNLYMTSYLQALVDRGHKLQGVKVSGGWFEIDTKEDLELYKDLLSRGKIDNDFYFS